MTSTVDFVEILISGQLGRLRLGLSPRAVEEILGKPEKDGGFSRKQKTPLVTAYKNLELGWDPAYSSLQYISLRFVPDFPWSICPQFVITCNDLSISTADDWLKHLQSYQITLDKARTPEGEIWKLETGWQLYFCWDETKGMLYFEKAFIHISSTKD